MYGGVYRGVISGSSDPSGLGRVQITLPAVASASASWANTCLPPDVRGNYRSGQQVWVMFENGESSRPVVIGLVSSG